MKLLPQWWKIYFLKVELGIALLFTAVFIIWAQCFGGQVVIERILKENRSDIYGALAAVFGSLLGFIITAVSIILGYTTNDRLTIVRESKHYALLWEVFTAAIRILSVATIAALVGLVVDRDSSPVYIVLYINVFTTTLSSFRLARCVWVLENIIKLVTSQI